jgi:hypothetical protein
MFLLHCQQGEPWLSVCCRVIESGVMGNASQTPGTSASELASRVHLGLYHGTHFAFLILH